MPPLPIALVDVIHLQAGLGALVFLGFLLGGVFRPARTPPRWLAVAVVVAYVAVALTGLLALLPLSTLARDEAVDGHLLAALVTVPLTVGLAVRMWSGRGRLGAPVGRIVLGSALAVAPVAIGLVAARAVTPLAEAGAGGAWVPYGLTAYTDRIVLLPDGRLLAGGAGLHVATPVGTSSQAPAWKQVAGFPSTSLVLGLLVARPGGRIFVGTVSGGFESRAGTSGPFRRLPLQAGGVHAFAVNPSNPGVVWATSYAGPERSTDGGAHFTVERAGMRSPDTSWAIAYFGPLLLCSDEYAVYAWRGTSWEKVLAERSVVSLDPIGRVIWSSSMGDGIEMGSLSRTGATTWRGADAGLEDRRSGPILGTHVVSVTDRPASNVMYAGTMLDGVAASLDGGATWSGLWEGLRQAGVVSRVVVDGRLLIAATDGGVYAYQLPSAPGASPTWWVVTVALGLAGSLVGLAVLGRRRPRPDGGLVSGSGRGDPTDLSTC